jgi:hypothetical protein
MIDHILMTIWIIVGLAYGQGVIFTFRQLQPDSWVTYITYSLLSLVWPITIIGPIVWIIGRGLFDILRERFRK